MKLYLVIVAALATVIAGGLIALLAVPFARPLAWALIIGIATIPHYRKLRSLMPTYPNCSSLLMVTVMTLFMVLPVTCLMIFIAQNAVEWYRELEGFLQAVAEAKRHALSQLPLVRRIIPLVERIGLDVTGTASKIAASVSQYIVNTATSAAMNLANMLLTLVLTLFILFFVYRDGESIMIAGIARFAKNRERALYYAGEIRATTTAVMVGTIFTCFIQGVLAGFSYYLAGLEVPVLLGVLTAVAGLLPVLGTAFVWGPVVVFLAVNGDWLQGVLLCAWCVLVVVAVTDNVIRPLAVGAKRNIPALAVILGAVGGVMAMGLLGLILGPILFALVVVVWRDVTGRAEAP